MTRTNCSLLLIALSLGGHASSLAAQEAKRDNPLPAELLRAWGKAKGEAGWMGPDGLGQPEFRYGKKGRQEDVPAFLFLAWTPGAVRKLPQPRQPFGLFLGGASMKDAQTGKDGFLGDEVTRELAGLKSLQSVNLSFAKVTDAGAAELASLSSLQSLHLGFTKVTDNGLKDIARLKLQALALPGTQVGNSGMKELEGMTSLKALDVSGTAVTDPGLMHLAGLKSLRILNLASTKVSDDALEHLAMLTALEVLDVSNTQVTANGAAEFLKALPKVKITR